MRPRLIRPSYFAWLAMPAFLYGGYLLYGLPHMIWRYEFYGSHADWSSRHYTRCTFIGPYGVFTVPATDGRCGWLSFHKSPRADQ